MSGKTRAYVKLPTSPLADTLVRREAVALAGLAEHFAGKPGLVPREVDTRPQGLAPHGKGLRDEGKGIAREVNHCDRDRTDVASSRHTDRPEPWRRMPTTRRILVSPGIQWGVG